MFHYSVCETNSLQRWRILYSNHIVTGLTVLFVHTVALYHRVYFLYCPLTSAQVSSSQKQQFWQCAFNINPYLDFCSGYFYRLHVHRYHVQSRCLPSDISRMQDYSVKERNPFTFRDAASDCKFSSTKAVQGVKKRVKSSKSATQDFPTCCWLCFGLGYWSKFNDLVIRGLVPPAGRERENCADRPARLISGCEKRWCWERK